ncbi:MAG: DsbE family thiol:disulfide interchange protein [Gammaproteobacteria bacterium]|jgi:cytochrome c biogenesis protein CcmG/thiol:disulfide interchange protein DsbE|nr:DsbE family thiol:disulfide interchange protein [Gammaproteobacteria bacterium]MBT6042730.1 DsbE family thiol:disulfide interchange protein [Gammaproteobacteria bacterium]
MNRRVKLFIPVALFLTMAGFLMFGLTRDPNVVPSALVDKPFPEFSLPSLYAEQGNFSREDILGEILIVNIWGSWCIPCHIEHPFLLEMSEKEPDITFIGISYDDSIAEDRLFLEERGNPFDRNVVDSGSSLRIDLGVTGAPETFLVDQNGMILYRHIGAIDRAVWDDTFEPLLEQIR